MKILPTRILNKPILAIREAKQRLLPSPPVCFASVDGLDSKNQEIIDYSRFSTFRRATLALKDSSKYMLGLGLASIIQIGWTANRIINDYGNLSGKSLIPVSLVASCSFSFALYQAITLLRVGYNLSGWKDSYQAAKVEMFSRYSNSVLPPVFQKIDSGTWHMLQRGINGHKEESRLPRGRIFENILEKLNPEIELADMGELLMLKELDQGGAWRAVCSLTNLFVLGILSTTALIGCSTGVLGSFSEIQTQVDSAYLRDLVLYLFGSVIFCFASMGFASNYIKRPLMLGVTKKYEFTIEIMEQWRYNKKKPPEILKKISTELYQKLNNVYDNRQFLSKRFGIK